MTSEGGRDFPRRPSSCLASGECGDRRFDTLPFFTALLAALAPLISLAMMAFSLGLHVSTRFR
jgi:hypothetical protein